MHNVARTLVPMILSNYPSLCHRSKRKRRELSEMPVTCKDCGEGFVFSIAEQVTPIGLSSPALTRLLTAAQQRMPVHVHRVGLLLRDFGQAVEAIEAIERPAGGDVPCVPAAAISWK